MIFRTLSTFLLSLQCLSAILTLTSQSIPALIFKIFFFLFRQGGEAIGTNNQVVRLNARVLAPAWYWKAVCDPFNKQSVFFLARNNIGDADAVTQQNGCFDKRQTSKLGVITCQSIDSARALQMQHFNLPIFDKNCNPSVLGEGFRAVIQAARFQ